MTNDEVDKLIRSLVRDVSTRSAYDATNDHLSSEVRRLRSRIDELLSDVGQAYGEGYKAGVRHGEMLAKARASTDGQQ